MFISVVPLLLMVVGVLVYVLSANGKSQELGRILFAAGAFAFAFAYAAKTISF